MVTSQNNSYLVEHFKAEAGNPSNKMTVRVSNTAEKEFK